MIKGNASNSPNPGKGRDVSPSSEHDHLPSSSFRQAHEDLSNLFRHAQKRCMPGVEGYLPQPSLKRLYATVLASHLLCPLSHELLVWQRQRPVLCRVDIRRRNTPPSSVDDGGSKCRSGLLAKQGRILRDQSLRHVVVENIRCALVQHKVRPLLTSEPLWQTIREPRAGYQGLITSKLI